MSDNGLPTLQDWYCPKCGWAVYKSMTEPTWCACCGAQTEFTNTPPSAEGGS